MRTTHGCLPKNGELETAMSTFPMTFTPMGDKSMNPSIMDTPGFTVPPKSLQDSRETIGLFDMNGNSFENFIAQNRDYLQIALEYMIQNNLQPIFEDVDRNDDDKVEVNDDAEVKGNRVESKVEGEVERRPEAAKQTTEEDQVTTDSEREDDLAESDHQETDDTEVSDDTTTTPPVEAESAGSGSVVLSLIETAVQLQEKYNRLKSNWECMSSAVHHGLSYLPIPGVGLLSKLFRPKEDHQETKKGIPWLTSSGYLPHGKCKRCAARQQARRRKAEQYDDNTQGLDNKSDRMDGIKNGLCITEKLDIKCANDISKDKTDVESHKNSCEVPNGLCGPNRKLSRMSKDCASMNRLLIQAVRESLKQKHTVERECYQSSKPAV